MLANLGLWILLWIFVVFYFSLSQLGSVGKREQIWVREREIAKGKMGRGVKVLGEAATE